MQRSHLAFVLLGSFLISALLLQWCQLPKYPLTLWLLLAVTGITGIIGLLLHVRFASALIALSIGIACAFLSVARTTHIASPDTIDTYATGEELQIHGTIVDEPDRRPLITNYTVEVFEREAERGKAVPVSGRVLVSDRNRWPEFQYGDEVVFSGTLSTPEPINDFRYDHYLSRFNIYAIMKSSSGRKIRSGMGSPFLGALFSVKAAFESSINKLYPEPHASFLAGLLTGSRRGIPENLQKDFQIAGLTHIIAISGYNITIVLAVISRLLFFLPLRLRLLPLSASIIAFTLLVGASASVVRAAIMGIIGLVAIQTGRLKDTRLAILWAAVLMVGWNPKQLWYDAGFQLSFLALIGITEIAPLLKRPLARIPEVFGLRETLQMTLAAELATLPWTLYLFGRLSLIAPVANVLTTPLIPLTMLLGFTSVCVSTLSAVLGHIIALLGWACLQWIIEVTHLLAALPFASI